MLFRSQTTFGTHVFPDGKIIDICLPVRSRFNDYAIDRAMQRLRNFTGITGVQNQDLAMTESMGGVTDRTREHLGAADTAIIAIRRRLIAMARDLQRGIVPTAPYDGSLYRVRSYDAITDEPDFERFLDQNREALVVPT